MPNRSNALRGKVVGALQDGVIGFAQAGLQNSLAAGGSLLEKVLQVLSSGYRHKAMFDGIKGGAGLTKNGR